MKIWSGFAILVAVSLCMVTIAMFGLDRDVLMTAPPNVLTGTPLLLFRA